MTSISLPFVEIFKIDSEIGTRSNGVTGTRELQVEREREGRRERGKDKKRKRKEGERGKEEGGRERERGEERKPLCIDSNALSIPAV